MIALALPPGPLEVLCLGAHPDDIEIACGGTLLELAEARSIRATFAMLTGTPERRNEARSAAEAFVPGADVRIWDLPDGRLPAHWGEVKLALEELASQARPDLVLCPRRDDSHQDHRLVSELVPTAWRDALVLEYEIPKWDGDLRPVTHYVPVSAENAERKVRLLTAAYPSQVGRDWWSDETFLGLMRLRGIECRRRYAEGFVVRKALMSLGA
ncbi:PIG-L deacetylase family protein [Cellulomonas sp. P24]|uniref:PIG-L deacetylase family protein n=1 Tax=Cellulomonas sp. P24 TaxID=2885206 RepID=UPI00216AB5FB|nr:PIG-L family deacetylase [Cellulomonas sp. P24]MCR6493766.1 PIG-L family deacetylase [Cellulomonas sp. P24]